MLSNCNDIQIDGVCEKKMTMSLYLYNLLRSNDIQNRTADN